MSSAAVVIGAFRARADSSSNTQHSGKVSADNILIFFFLIFLRKQVLTFHANLHEMSNFVYWEK